MSQLWERALESRRLEHKRIRALKKAYYGLLLSYLPKCTKCGEPARVVTGILVELRSGSKPSEETAARVLSDAIRLTIGSK
jgi:hypothetical protein